MAAALEKSLRIQPQTPSLDNQMEEGMAKRPLNVSIEAELIEFLKKMAAQRNVSVSAWISRLLSDWRDSGVEPISDTTRKRKAFR